MGEISQNERDRISRPPLSHPGVCPGMTPAAKEESVVKWNVLQQQREWNSLALQRHSLTVTHDGRIIPIEIHLPIRLND